MSSEREIPFHDDRSDSGSTVDAVYELREAAVEHGKAIFETRAHPSPKARERLIETKLDLEAKTVAVLDECADSATA